MKEAFGNMKWWQLVILGLLVVTVAGLVASGVVMKISNASLRSDNAKLVQEKMDALDAKEDYWRSIDRAYQDTMQLYHDLRQVSISRADSLRDARKEITKLKSKQHEIVATWDDNDRLDELERIRSKHNID